MDTYRDEMRRHIQELDDNELIARIMSGTLTDEAGVLANEELNSRGLQLPSPERNALRESNHRSLSLTAILDQAYAGKLELWRVFWIGILVPMAALVFGAVLSREGEDGAISDIAFWMYLAAYWVWAYFVWKCSENVERKFLGWLAGRLAGAVLIAVPLIVGISIVRTVLSIFH
jgi:hypothetical protein